MKNFAIPAPPLARSSAAAPNTRKNKVFNNLSLHGRKQLGQSFPVRKQSLKYVLAYNTTRKLPEAAPRTLQLPLDTTKVVTLIGIRRTGKTYILYETMRRLESHGVDRRQMVYLNFEDDRLLPIKTRELDPILQAHAELYPEFATQRKYIFFDEVQNVPRWETYVGRLNDTEEAQIFLTGSSSHLWPGALGYPFVPEQTIG